MIVKCASYEKGLRCEDELSLDEAGAAIWRGLEAGKPLGEIADTLVERYEVARDVAYEDVVALVTHMQGQSLLTVLTEAAT